MSLTISKALTLNYVNQFQCLTNKIGFDNVIHSVGTLDYEVFEDLEEYYSQGDFILTTFTAIRNDIEVIVSVIDKLLTLNIAGLAIKSVFISELPSSVIQRAKIKQIPIFIFDKSIYFEDIIESLTRGLRSRSHFELIESKLNILINSELSQVSQQQILIEINEHFDLYHQVYFLKSKHYINDEQLFQLVERYRRHRYRIAKNSIFKYKDGLFIILTHDEKWHHHHLDFQHLTTLLSIDSNHYHIGTSKLVDGLAESLKASYHSARIAEIENSPQRDYNEIGIYKLLLSTPTIELKAFVQSVFESMTVDKTGKRHETMLAFVENKGDIQMIAAQLHQHTNTIRYRLQKIKHQLSIHSDIELYELLSIAFKSQKLLER